MLDSPYEITYIMHVDIREKMHPVNTIETKLYSPRDDRSAAWFLALFGIVGFFDFYMKHPIKGAIKNRNSDNCSCKYNSRYLQPQWNNIYSSTWLRSCIYMERLQHVPAFERSLSRWRRAPRKKRNQGCYHPVLACHRFAIRSYSCSYCRRLFRKHSNTGRMNYI